MKMIERADGVTATAGLIGEEALSGNIVGMDLVVMGLADIWAVVAWEWAAAVWEWAEEEDSNLPCPALLL